MQLQRKRSTSERKKRTKRASDSERSERSKLRRHALAKASVSLGVGRTARGVLYFRVPLAWAFRGLQRPSEAFRGLQTSESLGVGRTARGVLYFCRPLAWACRGLQAFGMGLQRPARPAGLCRPRPGPPSSSISAGLCHHPRGHGAAALLAALAFARCARFFRSLSLAALASFARSLSLAGLKFPL